MKRREFIRALGGAATSSVLWPFIAQAQQEPVVIGLLHRGSADDQANLVAAIR